MLLSSMLCSWCRRVACGPRRSRISIAATIPGSTPARVDHVTAGPYHLAVSLYTNPANAGYALAFAVAPTQAVNSSLIYHTYSVPGQGVDATPVRATFSADSRVPNGIRGAEEITVKGPWTLQIQVDGSAGKGLVNVPITAVTLPAIPVWLVGLSDSFLSMYCACSSSCGHRAMGKRSQPERFQRQRILLSLRSGRNGCLITTEACKEATL